MGGPLEPPGDGFLDAQRDHRIDLELPVLRELAVQELPGALQLRSADDEPRPHMRPDAAQAVPVLAVGVALQSRARPQAQVRGPPAAPRPLRAGGPARGTAAAPPERG